ncbi:MAG: T9SS type A sorting domain-containing protein [Lentimicrobium sp.]|nr:T9SS type A sorting domain-containing protein [Lentimicrobium sp.]
MDGRIFKTTDGGLTWQAGYNRYFPGRIFEVQFTDEAVGYALADLSESGSDAIGIKKTADGGQHWSLIYGVPWAEKIDFYFVNADVGFCITENVDHVSILKQTTDGGNTWVDMPTRPGFSRNDIKFYDENHGMMVGSGAIKTDDGGQTWNSILSGSYNTIEYRSQQEVYIGGPGFGYDTQLLRSTDGGNTWETVYEGDTGPILDIALPDEQSIVINTREAIYKSDDNGQTWSEATSSNPDPLILSSLSFPSPQVGYVVGTGDFANMLKTIDGGNSWFPLDNFSTSGLNAVWFFNDEEGIVLGNGGLVLKTTSGGITATSFFPNGLNSPSFSVAPNPFVDVINIRVNEPGFGFPLQVTLTDIAGRELLNQQIDGPVNQFSLPANNLKPGIYLCQIITRYGRKETIKLVRR